MVPSRKGTEESSAAPMGPASQFLQLSLRKQQWHNPSTEALVDIEHSRKGRLPGKDSCGVLLSKATGVNKSGKLMASCRTRWTASKCSL